MLVKVLGKLEETCEYIGAYWTEKANDFDSKGTDMATNQAKMIKFMKKAVTKKSILFWTKAKEDMDRYCTAMSVINNSFNFVTEAKPPAAQSFHLPNIELTLHVPPKALKSVANY